MEKTEARKAAYDIDPIYIKRWSPRAFSDKTVEDAKLNSVFEAARWAPSAANKQPWHFIVAKTEEDRKKFQTFIFDSNVEWCQHAPVLVVVASKKVWDNEGRPNVTHAFDTGTAWGYLSLEANRQGLITHGMGGFNREMAKEVLNIPEEYDIQAVIAIGYHDPEKVLSEKHQQREFPSDRKLIEEFISEGSFS